MKKWTYPVGVLFDSSMKFSKHYSAKSAAKANSMVGLIKRTFTSVNTSVFTTLYKSMVRPIMEYASCIWSPYLIKDINLLENVQKRATRLCPELRNMTYLRALGLPTLQYRRLTQTRYDPSLQTFAWVWPRGWGPKYAKTCHNRQDSWTQFQAKEDSQ